MSHQVLELFLTPLVAPRCLSGRWGASIALEKFLVARSWGHLHAVLLDVFGGNVDEPHVPDVAPAARLADDNQVEQAQEYRAKLGKWRPIPPTCFL